MDEVLSEEAIEIDYGDVLMEKSIFQSIKALLLILNSYDLNLDLDAVFARIKADHFNLKADLLDAFPQFLTLITPPDDAPSKMQQAKECLIEAIGNYLLTSEFIRSETDPPEDDLIALEPEDDRSEEKFRMVLAHVQDSLNRLKGRNPEQFEVALSEFVDLGQLFDSPISLRSLLTGQGIQDLLISHILPQLDRALGNMQEVNSDFSILLTPANYPIDEEVEVDYGVPETAEDQAIYGTRVPGSGYVLFTDTQGNKVRDYPGNQAIITLKDIDLDKNPEATDTVTVQVSSSTQLEPEALSLAETGPSTGVFYGTIPLDVGGQLVVDGNLEVAIGDGLLVHYDDVANDYGSPAVSEDRTVYTGGSWSGHLDKDMVWSKAGSPYIISGDLIIDPNVNLIIEPGVEVRFLANYDQNNQGSYSQDSELIIYGQLIAEGTEAEPIIFTSTSFEPQAGDWGGINCGVDYSGEYYNISGKAQMSHCQIRYAEVGVYAEDTVVNLTDCLVEYCSSDGINFYGDGADGLILRTTIQRCGERGIYVYYGSDAIIRDCLSQENGRDGLYINRAGVLVEGSRFINNGVEDWWEINGISIYRGSWSDEIPQAIRNCQIMGSRYGVYYRSYYYDYYSELPPLVIENCLIRGKEYGVYIDAQVNNVGIAGNLVQVSGCDLSGSGYLDSNQPGLAVYNDSPFAQDCRFNYWGNEATAQMNAGGNPKDIGVIYDIFDESYYGLVNYAGWLIASPNFPPSVQPLTASTMAGISVAIELIGTDVNNDQLTYSIATPPTHGQVEIVGNIATYTADTYFAGYDAFTYTATETATDNKLTSIPAIVRIWVEPGVNVPVLNPIGNREGNENQELSFTVSGTGPGENIPELKVIKGLPQGASFIDTHDGTGLFTCTPTYEQAGQYNLTFASIFGVLSDTETIIIQQF